MKHLMVCAVAAGIVVLTGTAQAAPPSHGVGYRPYSGHAYWSINSGLSFSADTTMRDDFGDSADIDYASGYMFSTAVGAALGTGLRVEAELALRGNEIDTVSYGGSTYEGAGDATIFTTMMNLYYDLPTGTSFTPYFGGGLGLGIATIDGDYSGSSSSTSMAYQAGFGARFDLTRAAALDVGYRFFGLTKSDYDDIDGDYQSHNLQFGIMFRY